MIIDGVEVEVTRKEIKNLHLSVYPPDGRVHVSAPDYLDEKDIHTFVISKWEWVCRQREEIATQARQDKREYKSSESHYLLGERYRLRIKEMPNTVHFVERRGEWLVMRVQPLTTKRNRELLLQEYYRDVLKALLDEMVPRLAKQYGEEGVTWEVRLMKRKWGSCITKRRHLILNLELARVPVPCIEYVVIHELCHLMVPNHNKLFIRLLTERLPMWQERRTELNAFIALPMDGWDIK